MFLAERSGQFAPGSDLTSHSEDYDFNRVLVDESTQDVWVVSGIKLQVHSDKYGGHGQPRFSDIPVGFITLKAQFNPATGTFSELQPLNFYASSARVEYHHDGDDDWGDDGIVIHDSDDGLGPIYSYVIDDTVYGPQFHEQSDDGS